MNKKVNLATPWATFYTELEMLFEKDPCVKLQFEDGDEKVIKIYVDSTAKADALAKILPAEKTFGNVVVKVEVIPANVDEKSLFDLYKDAFYGNPIVDKFESTSFPMEFNYILFKKEVVQYFNDDLSDYNGMESTLYEDIAKDVFENHELISKTGTRLIKIRREARRKMQKKSWQRLWKRSTR